jgi:hypothetical protein
MNGVMARSTKCPAIGYFYSKLWGFIPRLDMVDYKEPRVKLFTALLTFIVISFKTSITPGKVGLRPKPSLKFASLNFADSSLVFSRLLLFDGRFVRAFGRAIFPFVSVILIRPKRFSTSFAIFIKSCLLHGSILIQESV